MALKQGDEIEVAGNRIFRIDRDRSREEALARFGSLDWTLPPGFRSSRDEANER